MIVGWLMRLGLGPGAAKAVLWIGVLVLIALFLWWLRHDAYNDGVRATDAKWIAASQKLQQDAAKAAGSADAAAVKRVEVFTEKQAIEKEKLDEAERTGASPLDVIFGSGDGVR